MTNKKYQEKIVENYSYSLTRKTENIRKYPNK